MQRPQRPSESTHGEFSVQTPGASDTSAGEDGLYLRKQSNMSRVFARGGRGERRSEGQREGRDKERRRGGNYKVFALVAKPAGDDLPLLLF